MAHAINACILTVQYLFPSRLSEAEKLARLQQKAAYIEQQRQLNATFGGGQGGAVSSPTCASDRLRPQVVCPHSLLPLPAPRAACSAGISCVAPPCLCRGRDGGQHG